MKNKKEFLKVIAIILVAIMCLSMVSCNIQIPVNSGSGTTSNKEENETGTFGSFDDIYTQNAYLGYGINIIDASDINSKNVLMTYPIFDMDKLMSEKLLKTADHGTSFESIEASSIEEFVENMSYSSSITSGSSVSASGNIYGVNVGSSVSCTNGLKTAFEKANNQVRSQYFLKIIAESKSYWLILQTTEKRYKEILSEEFKNDLYDKNVSPAQLFHKYGTHLLTSVAMGGNVYMYYTMFSYSEETSSTQYAEIASKIKSSVKASYGPYSAGVENDMSFSEAYTYHQKAKEYGISIDQRIYSIGGGFFGIMNEQTLYENYGDWQKSLVDEPVLIGIKDNNSLYPIWKLLDLDVEGAIERQDELHKYFIEYGKESYNELASIYDLNPIVTPKEITNISVGETQYYQPGQEVQVKAGDVLNISFDVLPENAVDYTKTFEVEDTSKATINKSGILTVSNNVKAGDLIVVTISAGNISEDIWLVVEEDVPPEPEIIITNIEYDLNDTIKGDVAFTSNPVNQATKGETLKLCSAAPTTYSKYYEFDGWYTSVSGGTKLTDKDGNLLKDVYRYTDSDGKWIYENDVKLYAHWSQTHPEYVYIETGDELEKKLTSNPSGNFMLIHDIDLGSVQWKTIPEFSGILDGDGNSIQKLTFEFYDSANVEWGLFKTITNRGVVRNVSFENCSATYVAPGKGYAVYHVKFGFLAAYNYGEVSNCTFKSNYINIDGNTKVQEQYIYCGIAVCDNYGYIHDVTSILNGINLDADTVSDDSADDKCTVAVAGGISSYNQSGGRISNCISNNNVIVTRACYLADEGEDVKATSSGITAFNYGNLSNNTAQNNELSALKRSYKVKRNIWGSFKGVEFDEDDYQTCDQICTRNYN